MYMNSWKRQGRRSLLTISRPWTKSSAKFNLSGHFYPPGHMKSAEQGRRKGWKE